MNYKFDVVVVGSGLAGVHAAYPLIKAGIRVAMIDGGLDSKKQDEDLQDLSHVNITSKSFSYSMLKNSSFAFNTTYRLLKIKSNVEIIQSLAKGGLSEAWSGICDFFSADELFATGLPVKEIENEYKEIANLIHLTSHKKLGRLGSLILASAQNKRSFHSVIKRAPVAFPYRARLLIDNWRRYRNFTYIPNQLVVKFEEHGDRADIYTNIIDSGRRSIFHARFLILAAGSLNTTRIALRSLNLYNYKTVFLTKPNYLVACFYPKMLFKKSDPQKSTFGQITIVSKDSYKRLGRSFTQIYRLNPLRLNKVLKFIPLPRSIALPFLSAVASTIVIADVRLPGFVSKNTFCVLKSERNNTDVLHIRFHESAREIKKHKEELKVISRDLRLLELYPLKNFFGYATTHYAGGVPFRKTPGILSVDSTGKLHQGHNVYVADSSTWTMLPAKPIALTIMANAARVGKNVLKHIEG